MFGRDVTIDLEYYNYLLKTQFESERINQKLTNAEVEILHLKDTIDEIMKYANEYLMSYQIESLKHIIEDDPEE